MPAIAIVGAQWGDEGKGKIVDLLAPFASVAVRYAGGANAGHTLVVGGEKTILHLVPSAILHEQTKCIIGQGTVIDPETLLREIELLQQDSNLTRSRLVISERAHVVLPHHRMVDGLREQQEGAIGTTKRGIGPAYEDKVGRRGLRMADFIAPTSEFEKKLERNLAAWQPVLEALGGTTPTVVECAEWQAKYRARLEPYVGDATGTLHDALRDGACVLLEGAQGVMLDLDHGTYPFVTSSTAVAGGACGGAGVAPRQIQRVIGITKAYTTRVGGGPFPTELDDETGDRLRAAGHEYGSTTGRPRRCGWLDGVALRYAVQVGGVDELALTKLDVLSGLPEIAIAYAYEHNGRTTPAFPTGDLESVQPVYETLPGWNESLTDCKSIAELPPNARAFVSRVSELAGCPVRIISVGPDRTHTLGIANPFES